VTSDWQWDPTLFAGAAQYYQRGRAPYAAGLAEAMQRTLALDGTGRLLDVGCGPGKVAFLVAHLFTEIVGVDADAAMLTEAARIAAERGVTNARWVHCRAEELPVGLGTFRVVTFAASFHWFDRPRVAATVRDMLVPGGVVIHVDSHHQEGFASTAPLPHPLPPDDRIADVRRRFLGADRRAGQGIRNTSPDDEDDIFRAAGFMGPQRVTVADGRVIERTSDDIVANVFSSSATAPHLFGDRLAAFEADVRGVLADASPSGRFSLRLPDNELKIWRPR
jgi:SAM-dependent methyltransferase